MRVKRREFVVRGFGRWSNKEGSSVWRLVSGIRLEVPRRVGGAEEQKSTRECLGCLVRIRLRKWGTMERIYTVFYTEEQTTWLS
jgi:hypothetical protein